MTTPNADSAPRKRGGWRGWRCTSCRHNIENCHCPTTLSWKWYGPGPVPQAAQIVEGR